MQGYLLILLFTVLNLGESIVVKTYAKRHSSGGMLMNAIITLFAGIFWTVTDKGGFNFPLGMIPLALINVVLFASGFYFAFLAFKVGPFGLTRLISNFSLMFAIFYGIFFLNEPTTPLTYIGIAMIVAAMFFMNYSGKKDASKADEPGQISLKWLIYMLITVVSNGFISILGRMQQIKYDNTCTNEFYMISTFGAFIALAVIGLIVDRSKLGTVMKHGTLYGVIAGVFNGAKNFVMLAVYLFVPISTASPIKTGLGLISAFLFSLFFYKEKYNALQFIGVGMGAAAVILLAL